MTTTATLEAELRRAWTLDNLAVYGDHLQQLGDPRGELIAVDVHLARHGRGPEVEHRRRRALRAWLGLDDTVDPTRGAWEGVRFAFGFIDDLRVELAPLILRGPAGPFVRGITLIQRPHTIRGLLDDLGAMPRPWLDRLTIVPRFKGPPPQAVWRAGDPTFHPELLAPVLAGTPRLTRLELAGHRLILAFPHPHVTSVRIDGIDALLPILQAGPAMPAVTELELGFARTPGGPVVMQRPWPKLVPVASFPALRRLDLSANEAQRATSDTQLDVFEMLGGFDGLDRLVELRVPSLRTSQERDQLQRAIRRMPQLRRLEVIRGPVAFESSALEVVEVERAWPRWDTPTAREPLWVSCGNDRSSFGVLPRSLIAACERSYRWFDAAAREAWAEIWRVVSALGYDSGTSTLPAATWRTALEAVGFLDASFPELRPWAALRERLRELDDDLEVRVGRQRSLA